MQYLDSIIVALVILAALRYLYSSLKPKTSPGGNCGCGKHVCPVPKAPNGKRGSSIR